MSSYKLNETQKPFKAGIRTDKFILEAVIDDSSNKIISFAVTDIRKKKETVKNIAVKKGDIQSAFNKAVEYSKELI